MTLSLYDLSGRVVATVAEGGFPAGRHAVTHAAKLPGGVYFWRLRAGGTVLRGSLVRRG